MPESVKPEQVRDFYSQDNVVDYYSRAASNLSLWLSEEMIFTRLFAKDMTLLEIGAGTGRIALGLAEMGYRHLIGVDFSPEMIASARRLNTALGLGVAFQVADALQLPFSENELDGAIFGFNGLMQIPAYANRVQALQEIHRVLKPGACLVFTTHDRDNPVQKAYWEAEKVRWETGRQKAGLLEYGDRFEETDLGDLFIHIPTRTEVLRMLERTGFRYNSDKLRSEIAKENPEVREFSDECRFWIAQKP